MFKANSSIIEMKNISKTYGMIQALKAVNLDVYKGEILGLLGPNGAGKTTIMKILTCFTPPSLGTFSVGNLNGIENPLEVRSMIGYMPEHNPIYLEMTVRGFLTFVGRSKSLTGSTLREHIGKTLKQCSLERVKGRIIKHLSKGYRQRVGLAQAIIGDPPILILDEPTIGLDPGQVVELRERIKEMGGKRTVILSSHILSEVSQICDRVVIVSQGQIIAKDSPKTLIQQLAQSIELELEVKGQSHMVIKALEDVRGVRSVSKGDSARRYRVKTDREEEIRALVVRSLLSKNLDLLEMRVKEMDLEDIFLHVVAHEKGKQDNGKL